MKCVNHPDTDAVGYCRNCGKALCANCRHEVRSVVYCEDCLAAKLLAPPVAAAPARGPSPGLAFGLGFIPGVGAIYNGQYTKAFVHVLIFGGLISILSSGAARDFEPLFGVMLAAFFVYMPFEAYRTAKQRREGEAAEEWGSLVSNLRVEAPIGAIVLIVLGVVFLLNSFGVLEIGNVFRFWPLILIVVGVMLLFKRLGGHPGAKSESEER